MVGQAIISEIDEAGYFRSDLSEVAERLGAPLATAENALALIQGFEPAGVGARNLAECLAIQLRERDRYDPAMAALIEHLDLVAKRDHAALMKLCRVDAEDLSEMLADLSASDRGDDGRIEEAARLAVRRVVRAHLGKKPLTDVHIVRI